METQSTNLKNLSREERGKLIFENGNIKETPNGWRVISQSSRVKSYLVKFNKHKPKCNCPDCSIRIGNKCKHIYAVEFYLKRRISTKGNMEQTEGIRVTYKQDWKAYNKSQTNEKLIFMKLLRDLCYQIEQPKYNFGRPTLPFSDMLFCMAYKVYSTLSGRRFMSDLKIAKEMGLIEKVPHHNSMFNFFNDKNMKPLISKLITLSSLPLREVEKDFAVDSSGFSTCRFTRWYDYKWGKDKKQRIWLKAHICTGVKTNIVTGITITEGEDNDSPQLKGLVEQTAENFDLKEVSGDKAYSSKKNLAIIKENGGIPYIPFKKNVTGKSRGSLFWSKMYHYFIYKNEEFLEHYHKRSNVETTFHMIKTKFEERLRSKSQLAQTNELLLKVLCHNVCCVIQSVNELGIKAKFYIEQTNEILIPAQKVRVN